jgi:biopolymer transport protein ExbD
MQLTRRKPLRRSLNLTPLVDLVFLLIFFFMLTTNFIHTEVMDIDFADTEKASAGGLSKNLLVTVRNDHRLEINSTPYEHEEFELTLRRILADHPDRTVLVRVENGVSTQSLVSVMDLVHLAGARFITLAE